MNPGRSAVVVPEAVLDRYRRFSLYNSPFPAHDEGCAIDLYPDGERAPSPVAGEVVDTRTVRAPPKPYAAEHDHLIVVDTGDYLARILHVEPAVEAGDRIERGDGLGLLVRAGFFAPWVPNHLHLGFRESGADPYRASGSLPIDVDRDVRGLSWDGTGTVVAAGDTWARLDEPAHPAPGEYFVGLASGDGILDGGFPHYDGGGLLFGGGTADGVVSLAGTPVGDLEGRSVTWRDCQVLANGEPVTGLALFCARDSFGAKLVGDGIELDTGDAVSVEIEPSAPA
jgi:hypothetical protein